jgi:biopolymer transport protein ExbB
MSISSTSLKSGLLAVILLAACSFSNSLLAQTDAGAPAAAPAAAPAPASGGAAPAPPGTPGDTGSAPATGTKETTALQFLILLGIASVCVVWFTFEGFMLLRPRKLAPPALIARLREALTAGNYQEAWNICKSNKCFLSAVLGAGLERVGRNKDAVEFAIEETAVRESTALKTNTTYLSVIGVVSPMIGLTGTVYGMIKAFHTLGENGISNPSQLAANIGEVLVATMSGLVVAIPAFVFFYVLRARAQGAILYAESQVYGLLDNIPYDQLSGVRIGENFSTDTAAKTRSAARAGTSQKVSRNVTTNCPACNASITVGTSPCPNCKTVLDWGT